jgi:dephospho-CoA kinase
MLKVGLTGGIAVGKSVVGEMFVALGAHLVQADRIAHALMEPGQAVYEEVVRHFGRGILNGDGSVNRARLAEIVFSGARPPEGMRTTRVAELNRIVHPAVVCSHDEWMEKIGRQDPQAVAMVEAALILEAGVKNHFDRLLVVTCNPEQRAERFATRHSIDLDAARREVARRMAAQLPDRDKVEAADFVIDNSGALDNTREQVREVWEKLDIAARR